MLTYQTRIKQGQGSQRYLRGEYILSAASVQALGHRMADLVHIQKNTNCLLYYVRITELRPHVYIRYKWAHGAYIQH